VGTLDAAVLIGCVGTSRVNVVTMFGEELTNERITVKLASLIHIDVFLLTVWRILLEKSL
jgi:hypothetical protein